MRPGDRRDRGKRGEAGETLVELLVAISILGTGVVALLGGIGTSIVVSDLHRKEATADTVVRSYAEAIENAVALTSPSSGYVDCARPDAYAAPAGFSAPPGFTATVTSVQYWSGSGFSAPGSLCAVSATQALSRSGRSAGVTDTGIQKLTLDVSSENSNAGETLALIIRKPCRESDDSCGQTVLSLLR